MGLHELCILARISKYEAILAQSYNSNGRVHKVMRRNVGEKSPVTFRRNKPPKMNNRARNIAYIKTIQSKNEAVNQVALDSSGVSHES